MSCTTYVDLQLIYLMYLVFQVDLHCYVVENAREIMIFADCRLKFVKSF